MAPWLKWVFISIAFLALAMLVWVSCLWVYYKRCRRKQDDQTEHEQSSQTPGATSNENAPTAVSNMIDSALSTPPTENQEHSISSDEIDSETLQQAFTPRMELIRSRFDYQMVSIDKGEDSFKRIDLTETGADEDSVIGENEQNKRGDPQSLASSIWSFSILLSSSWRIQPNNQKETCSICKLHYHPGQTTCTSKNLFCGHTFHDKCIESWLMEDNHNNCPVCHCNVMTEVKALDV